MDSFHSRIFLIGMPGSGKSTLGSSLAHHIGADFYDLDAEIEAVEKNSIANIFELHGEHYFRKSEADNLRRLATIDTKRGAVIATGGGTPCFFDNMQLMNNTGVTIFLDVSEDTLINRLLQSDLALRPKFGGRKGLTDHITILYHDRRPIYQKASIVLSGNDIDMNSIAKALENI